MSTGYKQLTLDDRVEIEELLDQECMQAEIARRGGASLDDQPGGKEAVLAAGEHFCGRYPVPAGGPA